MPNFNLDGIQTLVLQLLGSAAFIFLAVMLFAFWVTTSWGRMVGLLAGGLFVLWVIWFPASATGALRGVVSTVTGA